MTGNRRVRGSVVVYRNVHPAHPAPGGVIDGEVIDGAVTNTENNGENSGAENNGAESAGVMSAPGTALVPVSRSSALVLRRTGAVVRRAGTQVRRGTVHAVSTAVLSAWGTVRAARRAARHERTRRVVRAALRWLLRNVLVYPATGVWVALTRLWEARTTARYERMMRAAEAAGDLDRLAEWEQRAEFVRERRHRRRMQWIYAPLALVKAVVVAVATILGMLLALGMVLAVANRDISWVLAPLGAVVEFIAWAVWLLTVVWVPFVVAMPWLVLALSWNLGRTHGAVPTWAVSERAREHEDVIVTLGGIATALAHLGIAKLNEAIKQGWEVEFLTPPVRVNNRGYHTVFSFPRGVTAQMIIDKGDVLARNLNRGPLEVWPAAAERPGYVDLWVNDPGSTEKPAPPYPLLRDGKADVFEGIPFGISQRGDVIAVALYAVNLVFGGLMGQGKSNAARVMVLGAALDPLAELWVFVFANNGDFDAYQPRLARYYRGIDDDVAAAALVALRELYEMIGQREERLRGLPARKLTRAIAQKHPDLHPLVVLFSECHELFSHEQFGKEAADLAVQIMRRARKTGITLAFDTQSSRADAIPPKIVELVQINACFAIKSWRSNDGFLGDGSYQAGIRATELRPGKDVGTSLLTGATAERFEIVKWFYIQSDDDTGYDAATEVIARAVENLDPAVNRDASDVGNASEEPQRDLLKDVLDVLGTVKVNAADVPPRLRKLAPDYVPYRKLSGARLRELLAEHGVHVPSTGRRYPVDPAVIRARLAERATESDSGSDGESDSGDGR